MNRCRLLDDISAFVQKAVASAFLKQLFTKEARIAGIELYYRRIGTSIQSFQASYNVLGNTSHIHN